MKFLTIIFVLSGILINGLLAANPMCEAINKDSAKATGVADCFTTHYPVAFTDILTNCIQEVFQKNLVERMIKACANPTRDVQQQEKLMQCLEENLEGRDDIQMQLSGTETDISTCMSQHFDLGNQSQENDSQGSQSQENATK